MTSSTDAFAPLPVPRLRDAAGERPLFRVIERAGSGVAGPRWPDWSHGGPDHEAAEHAAAEAQWQRGFDEGRDLGEAEAATRLAPALAVLEAVTSHLAAIADTFARDRERDLHALAIAIAKQILQREIATDPAWIETLVVRAIERLPLDPEFTVRLHPEDLALLGSDLARLRPEGRRVEMAWVADARLERGAFVVETPHRLVDGRADVALRALYDRLDHD